jgi:hypothetical protein
VGYRSYYGRSTGFSLNFKFISPACLHPSPPGISAEPRRFAELDPLALDEGVIEAQSSSSTEVDDSIVSKRRIFKN